MNIDGEQLKKILLEQNYVSPDDIKKAEKIAKQKKLSITDHLISEGLITKTLLGQAIAESFKVPYCNFQATQLPQTEIQKIPENIARKYRIALFKEDEKTVTLASDKPDEQKIVTAVGQLFPNKKIIIAYTLPEYIDATFIQYRKPLETRFSKIIGKQESVAPEIIDEIMEDALAYQASDIHFEPQEKDVLIRFRIDGILQEAGHIPKQYGENIVNRIKVLAQLRIDEHFAAQDGSIHHKHNDKAIDLRVSIVPTIHGEKVVIRILTQYIQSFHMSDLGLSPQDEALLENAYKKPFGMILSTGPTGSGKSTTLYSVLKLLNHQGVNISTIEDPVEYRIGGVNHIQVNQQTDLTFSKGLRAIVRQDPDIILVGEIRDQETSEIAVNAALTGHLLLSTFHANDAATAIPRLLNMGIEPFLLASTLHIIIAQRLVRRICPGCRYSVATPRSEIEKILPNAQAYFPEETVTLYKGKGCKACSSMAYKGRVAIFEVIPIAKEMQELILKNPSRQEIWDLAVQQGARSLFEDGILKVKSGLTTLEEVLRVAPPS